MAFSGISVYSSSFLSFAFTLGFLLHLVVVCKSSTVPNSFSLIVVGNGHIYCLNVWWFLHVYRMGVVSCSASPQGHIRDSTDFNTLFRRFSLLCAVLSLKIGLLRSHQMVVIVSSACSGNCSFLFVKVCNTERAYVRKTTGI